MENVIENIFMFFASDKFCLPILYILIGIILYNIIAFVIIKISKIQVKGKKVDKKKQTIISLIKNIIKYLIGIFVFLAILEVYNVDTTKILASIGIVGVVVGLAFQDIIKDFLAGIFIIFDNEYSVGDYVEINGFTGEVIAFGLKTTKIKAYTGEIKAISNSSFTEVINYSLSPSKLVLDIPVSYNSDLNKVEKVLNELLEEIKKMQYVKGNVELLGLNEFDNSSIIYNIAIDCVPMMHYGVKRKVFRLIKDKFDKNKIEIPYNKLDVYLKNVERGKNEKS